MISIQEFVSFLQGILNNDSTESGYPDFTYNGARIVFSVRTPSLPYVDSSIEKNNGAFVIPVMVTFNGDGSFEAYPDVGMHEITYSISMVFPVVETNDMSSMYVFIANLLVGKLKLIGSTSGYYCLNVGAPSFGQMQYLESLEFDQFKQNLSIIFKNCVTVSREWCTMDFDIYASSMKDLGKSGGFIYGNQVSQTLTVVFATGALSETLNVIQPSNSVENNLTTQQGVSSNYAKSLTSGTALGNTKTVFVKMSQFWINMMSASKNGTIGKLTATIQDNVCLADGTVMATLSTTDDCVMSSTAFSYEPGKPLTFAFSVTPKATLGSV